jgi:phage recombination protein Bet
MENQGLAKQNVTEKEQRERGACTYLVAGQEVNLSYAIVRNFLTKGNGQVTDQDLTQFISICKYNQLNPFLNEAYLIKFGDTPASMIVSKEALMKRAETHEGYRGIQAGVIVMREGQPVELEGSFYLANDVLVGGWAKVYRKDRDYPYVAKVKLSEYDKKKSTWVEKPSTMIRKVAEVQALREAFPTQLGALYTAEEVGVTVEEGVAVEIKEKANKKEISVDSNPEQRATVNSGPPEYSPEPPEVKKPDF